MRSAYVTARVTASVAASLLAVSLASVATAQNTAFTDPANLRGERTAERTGRELPIDSGVASGAPAPTDASKRLALAQQLRRLDTTASLLMIVAHPDDEDGGMLAYVSRGLGARVGMLTLTRGEGGQNAVTGDFEDALGLLRTQELLSADRYLGVTTQMFGTEVDFGFSKTKRESFAKWGRERVLYDAVRAIRLFRPMVIASVFIGGVTDGHGQHQVSGEIAQEAFKAAADPTVFPDMIREGILPWQASRVYARVPLGAITPQGLYDYATNKYEPVSFTNYVTCEVTHTIPSTDVVVHEGVTDPLLTPAAALAADVLTSYGKPFPADAPVSYVQFARIGLGLQRTQIPAGARMPPAGAVDVAYHLYGEVGAKAHSAPAAETTFFGGLDTSLGSIDSLDRADAPTDQLANATRALHAARQHVEAGDLAQVPTLLAEALRLIDSHIAAIEAAHIGTPAARANELHELRIKRVELNDALALVLGLQLRATSPAADVVTGTTPQVTVSITSYGGTLPLTGLHLASATAALDRTQPVGEPIARLAETKPFTTAIAAAPALTSQATRPYFFRNDIEDPVYQLLDPQLRNAAATPPALTATVDVVFDGALLEVPALVNVDRQPVAVVPPASVRVLSPAQVLPASDSSIDEALMLTPTNLRVEADLPASWSVEPDLPVGALPDGNKRLRFKIPAGNRSLATLPAIGVLPGGGEVREGYRMVGYGDLVRTNFYTRATMRIVPVDLALPSKRRIAYVAGTGDAVPEALASIGLAPTMLTVADLTAARLAGFDTVILGVRAYAAHPELHGAPTQALLAFARGGGNVVVQYQSADFGAADAPYPLSLGSNEKVVDETAPVVFENPGAPVLTTPNRLSAADFTGWIEERGHGFMGTWDAHYEAPTETHDPGPLGTEVDAQLPQRGGLLTTAVGRGRWTYCAFALYRQLPEAVPGAFRLYVNLLAQ